MCEHQTVTVTKLDKFIICSECNELFWDALALDNSRIEAKAPKAVSVPTAANIAKAARVGAFKATLFDFTTASPSNVRYQTTYYDI